MKKIAIVGMGHVGAAAASNIGLTQGCDIIYAIDYNQELAQMQAKDLQEAMIISGSKTRVYPNDYQNLEDVEIMVITAGAKVKAVGDRLELLDSSMKIINSIIDAAIEAGFKGTYLVASNPVDVMSGLVAMRVGSSRVIGTGTILDNARFKNELSQLLNVDPKFIESKAVGEHGKSIVPLYSSVLINNKSLDQYLTENNLTLDKDLITKNVIEGGPKIFNIKGSTEFGIASSIAKIVNAILNDTKEKLLVTTNLEVESVGNVFIPTSAVVGREGVISSEVVKMNDFEREMFTNSAKLLNEYTQQIKSDLH